MVKFIRDQAGRIVVNNHIFSIEDNGRSFSLKYCDTSTCIVRIVVYIEKGIVKFPRFQEFQEIKQSIDPGREPEKQSVTFSIQPFKIFEGIPELDKEYRFCFTRKNHVADQVSYLDFVEDYFKTLMINFPSFKDRFLS